MDEFSAIALTRSLLAHHLDDERLAGRDVEGVHDAERGREREAHARRGRGR